MAFIGLPALVLCGTLIAKSEKYWEITGVFWVFCTMLVYFTFVGCTLYHEISSFIEVVKNQYRDVNSVWSATLKAIYLRQLKTYSGTETVTYVRQSSRQFWSASLSASWYRGAVLYNRMSNCYCFRVRYRSKWVLSGRQCPSRRHLVVGAPHTTLNFRIRTDDTRRCLQNSPNYLCGKCVGYTRK